MTKASGSFREVLRRCHTVRILQEQEMLAKIDDDFLAMLEELPGADIMHARLPYYGQFLHNKVVFFTFISTPEQVAQVIETLLRHSALLTKAEAVFHPDGRLWLDWDNVDLCIYLSSGMDPQALWQAVRARTQQA